MSAVLVLVFGCANAQSHATEPLAPPETLAPVLVPTQPSPASPVAASPDAPYGGTLRSVEFLATTVLRKEPRSDAARVGIIRKGTRARAVRAAPAGDGCAERWIQIAPRGWTCETAVDPSFDEPTAAGPVSLSEPDEPDLEPVVPGVYGVVRGADVQAYETRADAAAGAGRVLSGPHAVRAIGVVDVDGVRYWRTSQGKLIAASSIVQISPSTFRGIALDGELPAWVRTRGDPRKPARTRATPDPGGEVVGALAPRTIVTILAESDDGRFARINDAEWVARADLRVAALATPPPGVGPDDRWFDIDLDDQILIAYEGERPVYATLVSTGKWRHETPAIIARVASKLERAHMISENDEPYSVADVPWTMYYDGNFALHTSYWHDGFGGPRSHGCINLAPRDARLLFRWSSPDVPPGWTAVYADEDTPGSLVRIHSRKVPDPAFRGYARTLRDRGAAIASAGSRRPRIGASKAGQ
ncbi:MAG: murein L,D-transpeptidase [Deltaproteobacteria bacterium]|nr:MAG: murein L,D-transpeptidase [Deltaproteobacteria bacterium]